MEKLKIKNFKCFNDIEVDLNKLTILTGSNSAGKSTVLQSLLYLRRTVEHCGEWDKENSVYLFDKPNGLNVELNGSYCLSLGSSNLILPKDSSDTEIEIGILKNEKIFNIYFNTESDNLWLKPDDSENKEAGDFSIFKQEFYYLNAERLGPRVKQNIKFYDYPNTGYRGEFVAQLLGDTNFTYRFKVDDKRKNLSNKSSNLEQQTNAWLNFILPNTNVHSSYDVKTLSAQIQVENELSNYKTTSPNVGFGISYVLPIIVTGLIAKENRYMIIENPEAHLHPSAQSKMGQFLAMVAKSGVKVIVETHSDHIINGIQIAVAKKEFSAEDVTINFFNRDNTNQPEVKNIQLNDKAELSEWPQGFFDQSQKDYAELLKYRRNNG